MYQSLMVVPFHAQPLLCHIQNLGVGLGGCPEPTVVVLMEFSGRYFDIYRIRIEVQGRRRVDKKPLATSSIRTCIYIYV